MDDASKRAAAKWGSAPRRQPLAALEHTATGASRWDIEFVRQSDGSLLVLRGGQVYVAPLPMAPLTAPTQPGHPGWITMALDALGANGPAVDEALGVAEPTVDEWEAGTRKPSVDDLRRLATMTGLLPHWFSNPNAPTPIDNGFMCGPSGCRSLVEPHPDEVCRHCGAPCT
jgi:hypothetical protein